MTPQEVLAKLREDCAWAVRNGWKIKSHCWINADKTCCPFGAVYIRDHVDTLHQYASSYTIGQYCREKLGLDHGQFNATWYAVDGDSHKGCLDIHLPYRQVGLQIRADFGLTH